MAQRGCAPSCAALVTNANVWGFTARGVALGPYTNGTLDWVGCAVGDGCNNVNDFFCTDEANGIYFGMTTGTMRALIDPGNAAGSTFPASRTGCCTAANPRNVCNAPMAANNGVGPFNSADAMCKAMGFSSGVVVAEATSNTCPKPHSTTANGSNWTSDFNTANPGYGREYRCTR